VLAALTAEERTVLHDAATIMRAVADR
jgi:hypothetical protein